MTAIGGVTLNKEQLKAVKHKKGPLLIIAGAGTGKTTVVTERIKHLITKGIAKPSEILALTFTEKASKEMEDRVDVAMPYGYTQMWISTFHSFCDRILRREALHIGLDPKYKLLTQAETIQIIRDNLFKFKLKYFRPLGNPTKFVGGMLQHFSRLQDEDISPADYLSWAKKENKKKEIEKEEREKWLELANAYISYDELKVKEGFMDFGDVITKTLSLFRKRPNVLNDYRKQFKHVLVDEFQDTNIAQYELLKLLAPPSTNGNLTVVGDDSQSIYKFRGAAISNILHFKNDYKKASTVVLIRNYRSTQSILDPSYQLVKHNDPDTLEAKLGINKNLISIKNPKGGEPIIFFHKDRVENEAGAVAREIIELVKSGYEYKDIAILVRANNHADAFIRAFQRQSVPYQFLGPGRLFRQSEVIELVSYLKVLYNPEDSLSMYQVLSIKDLGISGRDIASLGVYSRKKNLSIFEACEIIKEIEVSSETRKVISKVVDIIHRDLDRLRHETAGQILYHFLEETELLSKILNPDTAEAEKQANNIAKLFDKLKTYEIDHEDATVPAVVDWINLSSELGESPLAADTDWTEVNAVNLLTVHSAKGLEFPVVFLVNLVSQRFPTNERREQIPIPDALIKEVVPEGDHHAQEERRLFYVGMTRAKEKLYFTAANYYSEGKREKKLSPFIFEALGDTAVGSEKDADADQLSFIDYAPKPKPKSVSDMTKSHVDYLSYSQIQTFQICPLHYKLRYILKIPTPQTAAQSFGTSIHDAMKDFYQNVKGGQKPSAEMLLSNLNTNWITQGYGSKSYEEKMYKRGEKYLRAYYKDSFNPKVIPVALEQPFVIPLQVPKGERRLKIGGKIDRVDTLPDGTIEIIDYKTGENIPDQKQVDKDLQLTFYALAATSLKDAPFGKDPKDIRLSLYYFEEQKKISTQRTTKDLKEARKEICTIRKEIENSDFACSNHYFCQSCEYVGMCNSER